MVSVRVGEKGRELGKQFLRSMVVLDLSLTFIVPTSKNPNRASGSSSGTLHREEEEQQQQQQQQQQK